MGISSVIASDCQRRKKFGALLTVQVKLIKRVKLYPVNFHLTGRSAANETFVFAVNFYIELTDCSISGVPCDLSARATLIGITGRQWVRTRGKKRFFGRSFGRVA